MSARTVYCATAIGLVGLVGCVMPEYLRLSYFQLGDAGKSDRIVYASLDTATQATQLALRGVGLKVETTPEGENLRLMAVNSAGEQLIVVFSRVHEVSGERTRVHIEAGSGEQVKLLIRILGRFEGDGVR